MQPPDSLTQEVRFVEVFKSKSGWAVGYLDDTPFQDGQVCLTRDMVTWRPLAAGGFGGSSVNHTVTCLDPEANDHPMTFTRVGDTLWWGGNAFERMENPGEIRPSILSLPRTRKPEYLFAEEHGAFLIYVSADKYNYSYESFRLFIGHPGETALRKLAIRQVRRMRDGGTTYIHTEEGSLYSPSKLGHVDKTPTWKGRADHKLVERDPSQFVITETDHGVRIGGAGRGKSEVQP
jgi:hypothetical protein